ncbi:hypothetical protein TorRG33x02_173510 [Trema orientale]|uniref:Uncharacterized protein n=1 Tax=Trema orientale TaxID=63057 RepID=A0A2P5EMX7_TREOI|nr:hypothetical protein TorRG33x02_173510 [Trema orientale]
MLTCGDSAAGYTCSSYLASIFISGAPTMLSPRYTCSSYSASIFISGASTMLSARYTCSSFSTTLSTSPISIWPFSSKGSI